VVGAIAPKLNQAEIERVKRKSIQSLDAYDCFLRGLAHSYVVTRESQEEAARLLYRAIQLDPDFSTPYGLLRLAEVIEELYSFQSLSFQAFQKPRFSIIYALLNSNRFVHNPQGPGAGYGQCVRRIGGPPPGITHWCHRQ
jgi:hypothetical protein